MEHHSEHSTKAWADYSSEEEDDKMTPVGYNKTPVANNQHATTKAPCTEKGGSSGNEAQWTVASRGRKRSGSRGNNGSRDFKMSRPFGRGGGRGGGGGRARGRGSYGGNGGDYSATGLPSRPLVPPRNASIYSMPYVETTSDYRQVPMQLDFLGLDEQYLSEITDGSAKQQLDSLKNQISVVAPWPCEWRRAVESFWTIGRINQACGLRVVSRAFYKLVELSQRFSLVPRISSAFGIAPPQTPLRLLHAGEAPGGFIEAGIFLTHGHLNQMGAVNHGLEGAVADPFLESWGISQAGEPAWAPCFEGKPHVCTFDLTDAESVTPFIEAHTQYFDGITCDGGFEVPPELRTTQEVQMFTLLEAEVTLALAALKYGGWFVLKAFAVDTVPTRLLLLRIWQSFGQVYLVSPESSKPSNDERFVVAQYFLEPAHRRTLTEAETAQWMNWFTVYAAEDKLRQYQPIQRALALCGQLQTEPEMRLPLEPGLSQAKDFCIRLGLPLKPVPPSRR